MNTKIAASFVVLFAACSGNGLSTSDSDIVVGPGGEGDSITYGNLEIRPEQGTLPDAVPGSCMKLVLAAPENAKRGSGSSYSSEPFSRAGFDGPGVRLGASIVDQGLENDFVMRLGPEGNPSDLTPSTWRLRFPEGNYKYFLDAPGFAVFPEVVFKTSGGPNLKATVKLYRLDVTSVIVTEPNGDRHEANGTYTIVNKDTRERVECGSASSFATNTGFDLMPGVYEITTTFATRDGTTKQNVSTVKLGDDSEVLYAPIGKVFTAGGWFVDDERSAQVEHLEVSGLAGKIEQLRFVMKIEHVRSSDLEIELHFVDENEDESHAVISKRVKFASPLVVDLAEFKGKKPNGRWTLVIYDKVPGPGTVTAGYTAGYIDSWGIDIKTSGGS